MDQIIGDILETVNFFVKPLESAAVIDTEVVVAVYHVWVIDVMNLHWDRPPSRGGSHRAILDNCWLQNIGYIPLGEVVLVKGVNVDEIPAQKMTYRYH